MVAIIDDREDVWRNCPNLIHVKPYVFFAGTSDINAPPGSHPSRPHTKNTVQLKDQEQIHIKPLIKSPKITTPGQWTDLKDSTRTSREDDVFDQDLALAEKTSQKRIPERQLSIGLGSVSDEELERMNAEIDAEIDVSSVTSSVGSNEGGVSRLVEAMDEDVSLSYDKSAGSSLIGENGRKQKHDDVSSLADNSPHSLGLLDESVDVSESSDGDSGDELAKLLGTWYYVMRYYSIVIVVLFVIVQCLFEKKFCCL